jgi:hypothetical protein
LECRDAALRIESSEHRPPVHDGPAADPGLLPRPPETFLRSGDVPELIIEAEDVDTVAGNRELTGLHAASEKVGTIARTLAPRP